MSRRASSESTSSGTEEIDRITCEDVEFRCREIVASRFHANDPLFAAAQRALVQSGDDIGLSDEEVVPYINALRIVHGDDHSAVAAYDRARLTDAGALRSAKARLRKCPTDRNLVTVEEFAVYLHIAPSSVFELLKKGLPSIKSAHVGRRILKTQAEAWLIAGGADKKVKGARRGR